MHQNERAIDLPEQASRHATDFLAAPPYHEIDYNDPEQEITVAVRAVK